jgi:putative hydrolase of the HAD superfamily
MSERVLVVDYGGVLTNPLAETFGAFASLVGLERGALAAAFAAATVRLGRTPMAELETGAITEATFVDRLLAELPDPMREHLTEQLTGLSFGELWFRGRTPNRSFLDFLHELRAGGQRLALLTNNVREWDHRWRAQLPVDELFDVVVNSADEGVRKPDRRIYEVLLGRLGVPAADCLFVDDTEENCVAAEEIGMTALRFTDTEPAIRDLRAALAAQGATR